MKKSVWKLFVFNGNFVKIKNNQYDSEEKFYEKILSVFKCLVSISSYC